MTDSLQAVVNSTSVGKKRKAKARSSSMPKKPKTTKAKVVPAPTPVDTSQSTVQSTVQSPFWDLLKAHGYSLDSIFKMLGIMLQM